MYPFLIEIVLRLNSTASDHTHTPQVFTEQYYVVLVHTVFTAAAAATGNLLTFLLKT